MKIIAISGDGIGAGKTTLARRLAPTVCSLAANMRAELKEKYPAYDWYNRTQEYKDKTPVAEFGGKTVREVLIEYGQGMCDLDPAYWVKRIIEQLRGMPDATCVAIDDLRKTIEIEQLRQAFPDVTHVHIHYPSARREAQYENEKLALIADYKVDRRPIKEFAVQARSQFSGNVITLEAHETLQQAEARYAKLKPQWPTFDVYVEAVYEHPQST